MSAFAASLLAARRARPRVALEASPDRPACLADGVAAQVALAGLLGAAAPAGFKIGATASAMQRYLGLSGPAASFMPEASLHGSGSGLAFDRFFKPGVECEIAVQLGSDLSGPCSAEQAREAVEAVMPAIELVENRYADLAAFGAAALVADQVFHAAAILGEPLEAWRDTDLDAMTGALLVDGVVRGRGAGRDLLGGPFNALAWLAGSAEAAAFGGLRAGQVVMLGSVCTPIWLDGPCTVEVVFEGMPVARVDLISSGP